MSADPHQDDAKVVLKLLLADGLRMFKSANCDIAKREETWNCQEWRPQDGNDHDIVKNGDK